MKKVKKLLAMIMAMTMVLGMAMTVSAAPEDVTDIQGSITVNGLSRGVDTEVNMYRFMTLQYDLETNAYSWRVADWASDFVELNEDGTEYTIPKENEADLKAAAQNQEADFSQKEIKGTSCTFNDVPIGAYVIIPKDTNADYLPLFVANTYVRENSPSDEGKPVVEENLIVYAKSEDHTITKELSDSFAQIGTTVKYTIHATFPMEEDSEGNTLQSFVIKDIPSGVDITENTVKVLVGNINVTNQVTISYTVENAPSESVPGLTVDFATLISGDNSGKDIEITYDAVVTDTEYNNRASATSDTTEYEPGEVTGKTGSIKITKVDAEDNSITLPEAIFNVYDLGVDEDWDPDDKGTPMNLVKIQTDDGKNVYRPALPTETAPAVVVDAEVEADGTLTIVGLDEGTYHFDEVYAPDGYSINEIGLDVKVEADNTVTIEKNFEDTKLASLPSTGGIGTTIFTIGGCAIMIAAAALYFASKRKSEEN